MASQSRLTESALTKHDHDQISSPFHAPTFFSDQEITSANRLEFNSVLLVVLLYVPDVVTVLYHSAVLVCM